MQQESFGDWLKHRRKALDLTQAELAKQVGCSAAAIRKMEAEERRPSLQISERLAEIFKIPSTERSNFLRFTRGAIRSVLVETEEGSPWQASTKPTPSNLPGSVTPLIGREREIVSVQDYLLHRDIRLITLIGPPGIGKTRLGIESARTVLSHFQDGVFFIALAPLDDPSLMAPTIFQALHYVEMNRQPAFEQLIDGIRDKQMLLVLDNCEHLIEDVAALASRLLSACSGLRILATSREPLRIPGEWTYIVPTLNVPQENSPADMETISQFPALILFAQRAQAVRSNFTLDASNIQAVTSICIELDGLPLAIELMAARMRLMTPQNLLEHWDRQFVLSADGMRAASPRQKNLNAAIAWSYNLLSNGEQKLFAHLSVFSGGFTLQDVETIFSGMFIEQSISALLTSLLDKSLLQPAFNQEAREPVRFTMLVTIQHFALSCLQSMGDEREARDKHLAYFLELAEEGKKEIQGPKQAAWLHRLASTRDNLRSALDWAIESGQMEKALKMASHLSWFWFRRSDLSEGRQWLGKVAGLPSASQYPGRYSYVLAQLAFHIWLQSGPKPARPAVEQALSIARANDDKWNIAWALIVLGLVLTHEGDLREAQSTIEKGKALFGELRDKWGYANATISLALGTYIQEELVTSLAQHQEALTAFRELGDIYFESVALRFIGIIQARQGNFASGIAALREALILAQQVDSKYEIAAVLKQMCDPAQAQGKLVRAVHLCCASRNIFDSIGTWQQEDEAQFQDFLITCRARLDESAFAEAVEQGRTMTTEQAIAYALEDQE